MAGVSILAIVAGVGGFFYLNLGASLEAYAAEVTFRSRDNYTGRYRDNASWSDSSAPGPHYPQSTDILVRGFLKYAGYLDLQDDNIRTLVVKDTLLVNGDFTLSSGRTVTVEPNGILIVNGNFDIRNGSTLINQGRMVITGSSANLGSTIRSAGDFYPYSPVDYRSGASDDEVTGDSGPVSYLETNDPHLHYLVTHGEAMPTELPTALRYFRARVEAEAVVLEWATDREVNNDFFTVERSPDGQAFDTVGTVPGAGDQPSLRTYSWADPSPLPGTSYYRLRKTDHDGQSETFNLVSVSYEAPPSSVAMIRINTVAPNPFSHSFFVDFDLDNPGPVVVQLLTEDGTMVFSETLIRDAGNNRYEYTNHQRLMPGNYLLHLSQTTASPATFRLIKR